MKRHPISRAVIYLYQQHITQDTPPCGRPGASCSQIAAEIGLVAFLGGRMMCTECSESGMGKTGKQQKRK